MEKDNLFESGSISRTYFMLALPVVLSMVLSVVYNVADTYFIARTQDKDLIAAVSLCAPAFTLLMAFGNIFGQGGTSLISRLFGRGDTEGTKRVSSFCFAASVAVGIALCLLMLLLHRPILHLLGANEDSYEHAYDYFMTLAAGAPFIVASFIPLNLLRAEGLSRESMAGSVSGLIVNIILDPIFISGLGWGAFGAALASVIGYAFSDVFLIAVLLKKSRILSVDPRRAGCRGKEAGQILAIGTSAAVTNIMSSVCIVVLNQYLLSYGNSHIAAMGIAQKISMVILLILVGMSFGASPIVGYYYGGQQYGRLKELLKFLAKVIGGTALVMTAVLFLLAGPCVGIFIQDETILGMGARMLRWQIVSMVFAAAVMVITICFQASGMALEALLSSVCRQGVIFVIVIVIASAAAGLPGILASQAISDVVTVILLGILFRKRFYSKIR